MKLRNLHSRTPKTLFVEDAVDDLRARLDTAKGSPAPAPDVAPGGEAELPEGEDLGIEEPLDLDAPEDEEPLDLDAPDEEGDELDLGEPEEEGDPLDLGGELDEPEPGVEDTPEPSDPWEEILRGSKEYAELVDNKAGRIFNKFNLQRIFKLLPEFSNEQELYLSIEPYASNPEKSIAKLKDAKGDVKSWGVVTDDTTMSRIEKAKKIANDRLGVNPEAPPEPEGGDLGDELLGGELGGEGELGGDELGGELGELDLGAPAAPEEGLGGEELPEEEEEEVIEL